MENKNYELEKWIQNEQAKIVKEFLELEKRYEEILMQIKEKENK